MGLDRFRGGPFSAISIIAHLSYAGLCESHARSSQLWRINDRRDTEMLLAPTHEEEVTSLIAEDVLSERSLPIKVYQIGTAPWISLPTALVLTSSPF